ncbi:hypothetical protein CcaverHIS631_0306350 [Cutaneotrichosporon cavernicola]|nr:hypothetical protein CcaverHIS631_0306350 [Cutaneotrichosporon cavernicola]
MPPRPIPRRLVLVRALHTSAPRHPRSAPFSAAPPFPRRSPLRIAAFVAVAAGGIYLFDRECNASALSRSLRTGYIGLLCTLDYKINFSPAKADKIEGLHERVAKRLRWVVDTNQGMYLKLGQAIGLQAALLPKPYREAFTHVFDKAPSVPYSEVVGVFRDDLGIDPMDVFEEFSHEALASASIAQVHKAKLRPELGDPDQLVAVKVQKPAIKKQMDWDLFAYRSLMWLAEKAFDIPLYFVADYVSSQMRLETSFLHEAANARRCAELLAETPELRDDIYVPKVFGKAEGYPESDRVLVMEWVDGCRLNDKAQIQEWGLELRDVMDLAISLNGAMTFSWGFLHSDPHPGNILVRPHPVKKGKPQLIVLDHGLYITLRKSFREEYATLWRSLFVLDLPTIERISKAWGLGIDPNITPQKGPPRPPKTEYEIQMEVKAQFKALLESEQLIPRELIFVGRCQRMLQANNQLLGSPSERINITAAWAAKGYAEFAGSRALADIGFRRWLRDRYDSFVFRFTLWVIDWAFWWTSLKARFSRTTGNWEDRLQAQMEKMAREEFGIEIDGNTAFLG